MNSVNIPTARPLSTFEADRHADEIADEYFPNVDLHGPSVQERQKLMFSGYLGDELKTATQLKVDEQEDMAIYNAFNKLTDLIAKGIFEGGIFVDVKSIAYRMDVEAK